MVLSNEPGYYLPGAYGIRTENLLLVQPAALENAARFLEFETLTLAPFDRALIDVALLEPAERDWIDRYHARVQNEIGPELPEPARLWLIAACAPLPHPHVSV
jgi:Xaa-Pro aminopeptidase